MLRRDVSAVNTDLLVGGIARGGVVPQDGDLAPESATCSHAGQESEGYGNAREAIASLNPRSAPGSPGSPRRSSTAAHRPGGTATSQTTRLLTRRQEPPGRGRGHRSSGTRYPAGPPVAGSRRPLAIIRRQAMASGRDRQHRVIRAVRCRRGRSLTGVPDLVDLRRGRWLYGGFGGFRAELQMIFAGRRDWMRHDQQQGVQNAAPAGFPRIDPEGSGHSGQRADKPNRELARIRTE